MIDYKVDKINSKYYNQKDWEKKKSEIISTSNFNRQKKGKVIIFSEKFHF